MAKQSNRDTITQEERLQLAGLLALGADLRKQWKALERAAFAITQELDSEGNLTIEPWSGGHTGDAFYEGYSADDLLRRLGIRVEE